MKRFTFFRILLCSVLIGAACQSTVFVDDISLAQEPEQCAPGGTSPLVCENFESQLTELTQSSSGNVRLEEDIVFDGHSSLRSETTEIESFAYVTHKFDAIEKGVVYFRVHLFVPEGTVVGTAKVLNLSSAVSTDLEVVQGIDINISASRRVDIYQHGNQVRYQSDAKMVPESTWFCLHGSYTISATAGETSIWINDDLAVSTVATAESVINGGVSEFRTGIGWTEQGQRTAVYYFDNILVDTLPVDCAPLSKN